MCMMIRCNELLQLLDLYEFLIYLIIRQELDWNLKCIIIQFWLVHTALFPLFAILYLSSVKPNKSKTLRKDVKDKCLNFPSMYK